MTNESPQFNHLFGPVPSRRLGMSLGIDLLPDKTCSLNCAYCECGKTSQQTSKRAEYIPAAELIEELDRYFLSAPPLDVLTFAGSGEPTLNTALHPVLQHIQSTYPQYKTAILTNSTFLHLREVRDTLLRIDYVLPSLDAVSQSVFEKINSPAADISCSAVVTGLIAFAKAYTGILWVEVFIIPGVNDTEEELSLIKDVLKEIKPTRVQLNTLDRPGAYDWVAPASPKLLTSIANKFLPLPVEIISRNISFSDRDSLYQNNKDSLFSTLKRRPMTLEDIAVSLNMNINETGVLLKKFSESNKISSEKVGETIFYRVI